MSAARSRFLLPALCGVLLLQACTSASRKSDKDKERAARAAAGARTDADAAGLPGATEVTEASLRGKIYQTIPTLAPIRFDYDQAALGEQSLAALKANAAWLNANPKVELQVQGHCDDRGTVAYNLALGQKRARAVRDYYLSLGVAMSRMSTISFGKEQPECREATEECWSVNRRAETRARIVP